MFLEWGVLHWGTCRILRVPDRRLGCHGWPCMTHRNILWQLCVDIFIRSVSRMGGQEWSYIEDVEGSWPETWRTVSSLTLWIFLVNPKNHITKILFHYLYFWLKYNMILTKCLTAKNVRVRWERELILGRDLAAELGWQGLCHVTDFGIHYLSMNQ